jgi:hypothetical protein
LLKGTGGLMVEASVMIVGVDLSLRDADAEMELDEARASRCAFSNFDPPNEARKNFASLCSISHRFVWTATLVKNL